MVDTFIEEEDPNSTEPNPYDADYIAALEEYINNYVENILDYEY